VAFLHDLMWPAVELREIRAFLTLAEELHFGRAAERLELSSSRLSQTIRTLEAHVGRRLFERTSRRVRPAVIDRAVYEIVDWFARHLETAPL
jgi:hypothetical protein